MGPAPFLYQKYHLGCGDCAIIGPADVSWTARSGKGAKSCAPKAALGTITFATASVATQETRRGYAVVHLTISWGSPLSSRVSRRSEARRMRRMSLVRTCYAVLPTAPLGLYNRSRPVLIDLARNWLPRRDKRPAWEKVHIVSLGPLGRFHCSFLGPNSSTPSGMGATSIAKDREMTTLRRERQRRWLLL